METLGAARLAKEIPAQRAVATIVRRDEITAVLQDPKASGELFLRVTSGGLEEGDEPSVIAMTWSRDELEGVLERATGENVVLTFDRDELSQAIGDVEAHGLRERALVFAVAATSALGTGAAIANAMPTGDDGGGAAVTSIAPAVSASVTDVSSAGGYTAPAAATTAADSMVSDAASGSGYAAPAVAATSELDSMVSDAASGSGYAAPAVAATSELDSMVSDAASGSGYTAPAAEAGASAAGSSVTDVSSAGGYGPVAATGSSGFLDIHAPGGTTDGLIAGSILLGDCRRDVRFAAVRNGEAGLTHDRHRRVRAARQSHRPHPVSEMSRDGRNTRAARSENQRPRPTGADLGDGRCLCRGGIEPVPQPAGTVRADVDPTRVWRVHPLRPDRVSAGAHRIRQHRLNSRRRSTHL